ncbi:MAG: 4-hydroxythreonine-4-phosphate dehydrogenase PdxA [Bdellovibrionales bacterium]|nr:4-hydroxythreonine-4-phosphate dehydrogenase PdxA [Bdellovibrionales bacterium]
MLIVITPGDPDGVGPEIVLKTILRRQTELPTSTQLLCVGARSPFEKLGANLIEVGDFNSASELPRTRPGELLFISAPQSPPKSAGRRGSRFSLPGYQSGWSIERAVGLVSSNKAAALVTGPICKSRLHAGGYPFPGHTEMLASLCKAKDVTMMLTNERLRVALVTTHLPLKKVPQSINYKNIRTTTMHTVHSLEKYWGIKRPRLAVAALNPHAGEGGLFGDEEVKIISPALKRLRKDLGATAIIDGPLPADTLFAKNAAQSKDLKYDAVICMYHDQGLIPIKLIDFAKTVNVTLGLPIIRTSVDHGVAFDLVGTGKADPSSFQAALRLAHEMALKKKEITPCS